jgi:hypothetical protein
VTPALLEQVAGQVRPVALAGERLVPVLPALRSLLPEGGLRRGSVVAVGGSTSLALALAAGASAAGSWCAAVGVGRPPLGPRAASELGVVLERFPIVAAAPGSGRGGWPWAVAALLEAVDVVVVWPPPCLRPADARRLAARARERGSVMVVAGGERWPDAVDVRLTLAESTWEGMGEGHGRLLARRVEVVATGRRAAARERRAALCLPAAGGGVTPAGAAAPATTPPLRGNCARTAQ